MPLVRAGLERVARSAGLDVTESEPAVIVLHGAEHESAEAPIDITAEADRVTILVKAPPDEAVWAAVLGLARGLLPAPMTKEEL